MLTQKIDLHFLHIADYYASVNCFMRNKEINYKSGKRECKGGEMERKELN